MSIAVNIREKLAREPFQPFRVRVTSGDAVTSDHVHVVRNPALVVLMKSELFIAHPNSDRHAFIPLLHVAAVEAGTSPTGGGRSNGDRLRARRRKKT